MDARQRIAKQLKSIFNQALDAGDFEINHKVNVDRRCQSGGVVDYNGDEFLEIKSARIKHKSKDGAEFYMITINVEG